VSSSSGGSGSVSGSDSGNRQDDFTGYDANAENNDDSSPSDVSPEESNGSSAGDGKQTISDSSSGDDSGTDNAAPPAFKRRKNEKGAAVTTKTVDSSYQLKQKLPHQPPQIPVRTPDSLPSNIAKKGGISHSIRLVEALGNGAARLRVAPAVVLPPFAGIGKRSTSSSAASIPDPSDGGSSSISSAAALSAHNKPHVQRPAAPVSANISSSGPTVIDNESSSTDSSTSPKVRGQYHLNEDDMILMDDVLMCPFVFRTQEAVACGAFAECVMPGMLRAHFSSRNKLLSLELVYDAMGFMQQLERASGNEGSAQIVPGSLEMALTPSSNEARVITLAQPPYLIVNVNDVWTRTTGYTQMEVEGKEYESLLEGEGSVPEAKERRGKPPHQLEAVAKGRSACSTNIHYDKGGRDFIEFVCSFPLTNANDEITHILHVSKELPSYQESLMQQSSI
jgi:hypothetical protein